MKNVSKLTSLQQARKNTGLSLSDMAQLLITDVSNLSKYERGIRTPSTDIVMDYHTLTGEPLEKLFNDHKKRSFKFVTSQLRQKLTDLEKGMRTLKTDKLATTLKRCMERLNCLQDVTERKNHEG